MGFHPVSGASLYPAYLYRSYRIHKRRPNHSQYVYSILEPRQIAFECVDGYERIIDEWWFHASITAITTLSHNKTAWSSVFPIDGSIFDWRSIPSSDATMSCVARNNIWRQCDGVVTDVDERNFSTTGWDYWARGPFLRTGIAVLDFRFPHSSTVSSCGIEFEIVRVQSRRFFRRHTFSWPLNPETVSHTIPVSSPWSHSAKKEHYEGRFVKLLTFDRKCRYFIVWDWEKREKKVRFIFLIPSTGQLKTCFTRWDALTQLITKNKQKNQNYL